jgi:23S rRNA (adenine2503-C2)-methyltransferase
VTSRYGAAREEYGDWLAQRGQPRYRLDQVWRALYEARAPLADATALPKPLRADLAEAFPDSLECALERTSDDATTKWLWSCTADRVQIETVLMRYPRRATVCVSSQAGCAMGCTFCATGQAGFDRHLTSAEIVEQVARAMHSSPQPVRNVVFMGMGEPLANYDETWDAVEALHGRFGISARHITVSTVGIVPGMRRLAEEQIPVTLAVSLHAADDDLRSTLVPINRRYPIAEVLDAAAAYAASKGRRVSFEYACIDGVNDDPRQAIRLANLLRPLGALGAHVNVIPLNPTSEFEGSVPSRDRVRAFADALREHGVNVTVRRNRGTGIDAACGQLRRRATTS